ncbi:MAG: hypothetical protein GC181_09530 [Bacteroidetes bacterium]|nr:hypothetical protein [Bacteroidota bacterium]
MRGTVGIILIIAISGQISGCKPGNRNRTAHSEEQEVSTDSEPEIQSVKQVKTSDAEITTEEVSEENEETDGLYSVAVKILHLIKNFRFDTLQSYIHPSRGVAFSPYGYIDSPLVFKPKELNGYLASDSVFCWGYYDGSGDSILMTFPDYIKSFVYCADFLDMADTSVNRVYHAGNTLNNFKSCYPSAQYIDFHVEGTEEYGGMDWRTLRMGFVKVKDQWKLIALIHDEWTI